MRMNSVFSFQYQKSTSTSRTASTSTRYWYWYIILCQVYLPSNPITAGCDLSLSSTRETEKPKNLHASPSVTQRNAQNLK